MKNCGSKTKHTCAEKNYATCIYYEPDLEVGIPNFSSLFEQDCITIEDTTKDQYEILAEIKSEIDLSALGEEGSCITNYMPTPEEKIVVKNVLLRYEQEICTLIQKVETLETTAICDIDITKCGLLLPGDPCNNSITTLGELLKYLIDNTTPPTQ